MFKDKQEFVTTEARMSRKVLGMQEFDAISAIEHAGLLAFVQKRDKMHFRPICETAHSYRLLLSIRQGKVISAEIG